MPGLNACFLLLALASTEPAQPAEFETVEVILTGFLDDYPQLTPSAKDGAVLSYRNGRHPLKGYRQFFVAPVKAFLGKGVSKEDLSLSEIKAIAEFFRGRISEKLDEFRKYQVVDARPPDGVCIRLALTNISPAPSDENPAGRIFGQVFGVQPPPVSIAIRDLGIEAEARDCRSEERLAALVNTGAGDRLMQFLSSPERAKRADRLLTGIIKLLNGEVRK